MNILRNCLTALVPVALIALTTGAAHAQVITITVDEHGNGIFNFVGFDSPLASTVEADPGPGGAPNALTYGLGNPMFMDSGDVLVFDPNNVTFSDVVRFNGTALAPDGGTGTLVFYSNPIGGFDSAADQASPPGSFYGNTARVNETLAGDFFYTPNPGQPGFVENGYPTVTYHIISDSAAAPEPGSIALLLAAGAPIAGVIARRRKD